MDEKLKVCPALAHGAGTKGLELKHLLLQLGFKPLLMVYKQFTSKIPYSSHITWAHKCAVRTLIKLLVFSPQ